MHELTTGEVLRLVVPATTGYLRHIRVLAATVADDVGFDVAEIEALRIAVDELCALALGDSAPGAQLSIEIGATETGIRLEGTCGPVTEEPEIDPIAAALLHAGAREFSLTTDGDTVRLSLSADRSHAAGGR